jgi:hypothetical protein
MNTSSTAGAGEPQDLPIIDDLNLGERHQQVGDVPRIAELAEKGAEDRPLRIIAAARKGIAPGEAPSAGDGLGGGARRQRGRGDGVRVFAPHVDLRRFRIAGDDPLVLGQYGIDPGRGGAAIGQLLDDLREQAEAALQAAEPLRLQELQDAGRVVFSDRLGRHVAGRRGGRSALGEKRDQRPGAAKQLPLVLGEMAVVAEKAREVAGVHCLRPPLTGSGRG